MSGEFINPNWHVVLMHFPMGLLTVGLLVELIALGWPGRGFRAAGRWMILLGALAAVPTLLAGLYALRQTVLAAPPEPELAWYDVVRQSHWSADQWTFMTRHLLLNSFAVAAFVIVAVAGLTVADRPRTALYWPLLLVLLLGVGLVSAGAWFGGEAVYRLGTGVVVPGKAASPATSQVSRSLPPEGTSATVSISLPPPGTSATLAGAKPVSPKAPTSEPEREREHVDEAGGIDYFIPPLQLHVVLAGLAIAFALGAPGLTMRNWQGAPEEYEDDYALQEYARRSPALARPGPHAAPPLEPDPVAEVLPPPASPRGFWLIGALLLAGTALAGAWSFMGGVSADVWRTNLEMLRDPDHLRVLIHVSVGVALLLLALLSGISRGLAWRHRAISKFFTLLLLAALVVQLWLGIAILFDGHTGPLLGFNPPVAASLK